MPETPPVFFLMGPTASGKSALAMTLAGKLALELISVDATQVYCGLDIGSAKPSAVEQQRIPHHLIDIRDAADPYSAADFRQDALAAIENIHRRGKTPLLVGGTMLYYKVLLQGLADLPDGDAAVRAEIDAEAEQKGWPAMHQQLAAVDPETARRLHPNHSQRIARALEIFRLTGRTMTELHRQHQNRQQQTAATNNFEDQYKVSQVALLPSRESLHRAIDKRFEQMLAQGLVDEVRALKQRPDLNLSLPSVRSVGYRQVWQYLDAEHTYTEMVAKGKAATRQLAKRQVTWLRSWPKLQVLNTEGHNGESLTAAQIFEQALNCFESGTI